MMKTIFFLLIPAFTFFSCNFNFGIDEAEKAADLFHRDLINNAFERIIDHQISSEALEITTSEEWLEIFELLNNNGGVKEVKKKMGFNSTNTNGVHIVRLEYNYTLNDGTEMNEILVLIKENERFKLKSLEWN